MSAQIAEKVALRYRQKGKALRQRRKQYRQNKAKAKRQSQKWRTRNPSKVKRYERKRQMRPQMHQLRRRSGDGPLMAEELDINIWDLDTDRHGEIDKLDLDEGKAQVMYDGSSEPSEEDLVDLLGRAVVVDPEDENELFETLDEFYGGEDEEDGEVAARVAARFGVFFKR